MPDEIRGVIIDRSIPRRGPNDSETINAFMEEVKQEITLLREAYNTWVRPILFGLPSRANDPTYELTTDPTDPTDIDAVVHGLDGTQIFTDNDAAPETTDPRTGNDYNEIYYIGGRPRTVKETIDEISTILDELYETVNGLADIVNTYISSSSDQALQLSQLQSMISSGNLQTILNNVIQVARDMYDIGEAALTGNGVRHLADTLQTKIADLETSISDVNTTLNVDKLGDEHIKADAGIGSSKIGITAPVEYVGAITTLQRAIDRIVTVLSVLAHGTGSFVDWANLPAGPPNITPQSLSSHINYVGGGTSAGATITNPHATSHADTLVFDTVADLVANGLDGDLNQTFIRNDVNELLHVVAHYTTYERDSLQRVSIERHYDGVGGSMLYRRVFIYIGNTDTVSQEIRTDYRRSLRIPGAPPVVTTTTYAYDGNGRISSATTV